MRFNNIIYGEHLASVNAFRPRVAWAAVRSKAAFLLLIPLFEGVLWSFLFCNFLGEKRADCFTIFVFLISGAVSVL